MLYRQHIATPVIPVKTYSGIDTIRENIESSITPARINMMKIHKAFFPFRQSFTGNSCLCECLITQTAEEKR